MHHIWIILFSTSFIYIIHRFNHAYFEHEKNSSTRAVWFIFDLSDWQSLWMRAIIRFISNYLRSAIHDFSFRRCEIQFAIEHFFHIFEWSFQDFRSYDQVWFLSRCRINQKRWNFSKLIKCTSIHNQSSIISRFL